MDAEQLQILLNENIFKGLGSGGGPFSMSYTLRHSFVVFNSYNIGDLKSGGFSIDACRSMVALMDVSYWDGHCVCLRLFTPLWIVWP